MAGNSWLPSASASTTDDRDGCRWSNWSSSALIMSRISELIDTHFDARLKTVLCVTSIWSPHRYVSLGLSTAMHLVGTDGISLISAIALYGLIFLPEKRAVFRGNLDGQSVGCQPTK